VYIEPTAFQIQLRNATSYKKVFGCERNTEVMNKYNTHPALGPPHRIRPPYIERSLRGIR